MIVCRPHHFFDLWWPCNLGETLYLQENSAQVSAIGARTLRTCMPVVFAAARWLLKNNFHESNCSSGPRISTSIFDLGAHPIFVGLNLCFYSSSSTQMKAGPQIASHSHWHMGPICQWLSLPLSFPSEGSPSLSHSPNEGSLSRVLWRGFGHRSSLPAPRQGMCSHAAGGERHVRGRFGEGPTSSGWERQDPGGGLTGEESHGSEGRSCCARRGRGKWLRLADLLDREESSPVYREACRRACGEEDRGRRGRFAPSLLCSVRARGRDAPNSGIGT